MDSTLNAVLAQFPDVGMGVRTPHKPAHAAIAQVWLLDDRYVLRARTRTDRIEEAFQNEQRLLEQVRPLLPYRLPAPLQAQDGQHHVIHADCLWTVHAQLPGRVVSPWQQLHRAPESDRRRLVSSLRQLHDATRGRLSPPDWLWITRDVSGRLQEVLDLASPSARTRVDLALRRIRDASANFTPDDSCFVHGDYHWGNLLVDDSGEIAGLLDLDWCRVAHPLEDLAYTAMMLLRDYDTGHPQPEPLDDTLDLYGVASHERALFDEYLILYTLFDVHLFHTAHTLNDREQFLSYQLALLETLCARNPRRK